MAGGVIASFVQLAVGSVGNSHMASLRKDSQFLNDLNDQFTPQYDDYFFLSFYETKPLTRLGVVSPVLQLQSSHIDPSIHLAVLMTNVTDILMTISTRLWIEIP